MSKNSGRPNGNYRGNNYSNDRNYRRGYSSGNGSSGKNVSSSRSNAPGKPQYSQTRPSNQTRTNTVNRNTAYSSRSRNAATGGFDFSRITGFFSSVRNNRNSGGNMTTRKKVIIAAVAVLLVLVLLVGIVLGGISCVLGQIDYMSEEELMIPDNLDSIVLEDDEITSASDTLDDAQKQEIDNNVQQSMVGEDGLRYEEGVTNILVLGVDARRTSTKRSRSDVIIIVSINENSNKIVLSSIMRDTYVAIPGRSGNDKINAACAYGGPALTVDTVERAFGIKIDHFVMVNFYSFMDIVDALGGVTVEINGGERKVLNQYIEEINKINGLNPNDGKLQHNGDAVTLTGKQAMGYVRIRYSGNGDYERTERQREVLEQLIQKARSADYATLIGLVNDVASNVSTDYTMSEITALALNATKYVDYDISQIRIPADGTFWSGIYHGTWILDIDFAANRELLYSNVFDNYQS